MLFAGAPRKHVPPPPNVRDVSVTGAGENYCLAPSGNSVYGSYKTSYQTNPGTSLALARPRETVAAVAI